MMINVQFDIFMCSTVPDNNELELTKSKRTHGTAVGFNSPYVEDRQIPIADKLNYSKQHQRTNHHDYLSLHFTFNQLVCVCVVVH